MPSTCAPLRYCYYVSELRDSLLAALPRSFRFQRLNGSLAFETVAHTLVGGVNLNSNVSYRCRGNGFPRKSSRTIHPLTPSGSVECFFSGCVARRGKTEWRNGSAKLHGSGRAFALADAAQSFREIRICLLIDLFNPRVKRETACRAVAALIFPVRERLRWRFRYAENVSLVRVRAANEKRGHVSPPDIEDASIPCINNKKNPRRTKRKTDSSMLLSPPRTFPISIAAHFPWRAPKRSETLVNAASNSGSLTCRCFERYVYTRHHTITFLNVG